MSAIRIDEIRAAIEQAQIAAGIRPAPVAIPATAFSVAQYMDANPGVPETTAYGQLHRAVRRGKLVIGKRLAKDRFGRMRLTTFFWRPCDAE